MTRQLVRGVFAFPALLSASSVIATSIQELQSCSNATHLHHRISQALHTQETNGQIPPFTLGLHGVVDGVLSPHECRKAVVTLNDKFSETSGYRTKIPRMEGFSGADLRELSSLTTVDEYEMLLKLRGRAKDAAERALGLCPGTLFVDFTHFTKKTVGAEHSFHADNCVVGFGEGPIAVCVKYWPHPSPQRIVSSILFLDDNFDGGEFYWADRKTGLPAVEVKPKPGRMVAFTSGPECLHGALPVKKPIEGSGTGDTRHAIAMWYVVEKELEELIPEFVGIGEEDKKAEETRTSHWREKVDL